MRYRLLLLSGVAALAAVPAAAHAAPTCSYDTTTRVVSLAYGPVDTNVTLASGPTLRYAQAGGLQRDCMSPSGVAATAANTVKVNIRAASGTGAGAQTTTIDETAGNLMAANRNLKLSVLTGTNDRLVVRKGAGDDLISLRDQTGLGLGPAIDLDYDGLVDLTMTTDDTVVEVDGGVGKDVIDGWSVHSYRMLLRGEDDSDQLYGGYNTDKLDGGFGDDHLYGRDGVSESIVGGGGYDDAQVDPGDSIPGVEAPRF